MRTYEFVNYFLNPKSFILLLIASIYLGPSSSCFGQDVAELAMRARNHLYDSWNFDSVAYYFDRVIGEKYAPAFAYSDYGWYLMLVDQYDEGLDYIERAAKMAPKDKQLVAWNSWALYWNGDLPKAKQWINKALAIDPDYGEALHVSSRIASAMGNHQEALRLAENAAANDPNWRAMIPWSLAKAGRKVQAIAWAEKIAQDEKVFDLWLLLEVYAHLENHEKALDYLEKSYNARYPFMPWLTMVQELKHLHDYPRFKAIVKKLNLP